MSTTQNAPAVPAWKRLGLKLKGAASDGNPATTTATQRPTAPPSPAANANARSRFAQQQQPSFDAGGYGSPAGFNKRKQYPSGSYPASDNQRFRRDNQDFGTPSRKAVSFSGDTKKAAPKKPKKKKQPKPVAPKEPFNLTPALEYLKTWHTARDSWKFNKNHQTLLLRYLYNGDAIPSSDIGTFYLYIRDIKGGGRSRLLQQAEEIKKKDMEDGAKGFPEGTKDVEEKQKQYEEMLAELLEQKADIKHEIESIAGAAASTNGRGVKRSFDEVAFVLRTVDKDVKHRVLKRMRAETVIDKLEASDSEESTASAPSTTMAATLTSTTVQAPAEASNENKRVKLNDGKAKRRKKLRTADVDSSSSESESDSSSSSSDSDSDDDDEAKAGLAGEDAESSSSRSSSSSEVESEAEADSESESETEAQPATAVAAEENSSDESESSDDEK